MAHGLAFHYFPGGSFLHRWDARCKFLGLMLLTFGLLHVDVRVLALFSVLIVAAMWLARLPWRSILQDLKAWGWLLLVIFLFQAVVAPGDLNSPGHRVSFVEPGQVRLALLTCWRLTLVLFYAILFTLTTRPGDMQNALIWLLRPFPFLPARRIALMATLTLRFIPLVLDEAEEIRMANRARGGHRRKNPVLRVKYFVLPLIRRSILRANELAMALAARGYREDLPLLLPGIPPAHLVALVPLAIIVTLGSTRALGLF